MRKSLFFTFILFIIFSFPFKTLALNHGTFRVLIDTDLVEDPDTSADIC